MVKRFVALIILGLAGLWACTTYQPPPPSFYIGEIPPAFAARLSLDERIQAEDAWRSLREGNAGKAEKILSRFTVENPLYYPGMGYAAYLRQDIPGAERYFLAAVEAFPELLLGHVGLAEIYLETDRGDLAFTELREVLKSDPEHHWARPQFERIRERKTAEALSAARSLSAGGDTEGAASAYLKTLYYSPKLKEAHLALAGIYNTREQPQDALVHLKAILNIEPDDVETLLLYGETLIKAGEPAAALEMYERVLEISPDSSQARQKAESLKNQLGIFELPSQYDTISTVAEVTKEQMAALLGVNLKDHLVPPPGNPPIIIDISTSWASRFILKIAALGILDVYPNHTFQPTKVIHRGEMAEILFRVVDRLQRSGHRFIQHLPPDRIQIADVTPEHFYYRPIIMMISYDIMSLSQGRMFHPDRPVSGREAIQLIDIILALLQ